MNTYNISIAGLGGQGIVKASDILADAAFRAGRDIKKAEVHGMSQRGGSVNTDIRFGPRILSPMIPDGEVDILVVMEATQVANNRQRLHPDGVLLTTEVLADIASAGGKSANVAMLGVLSARLDLPESVWQAAICAALPEPTHAANLAAFAAGRAAGRLSCR
jgi:indolepyruvate ferredoxin oxidoreductase beta subunit